MNGTKIGTWLIARWAKAAMKSRWGWGGGWFGRKGGKGDSASDDERGGGPGSSEEQRAAAPTRDWDAAARDKKKAVLRSKSHTSLRFRGGGQ